MKTRDQNVSKAYNHAQRKRKIETLNNIENRRHGNR